MALAALANLTTHAKRQLRDYLNVLSNRAPGIDAAAILDGIINWVNTLNNGLVSGTITIAIGQPSGTAAVGAALDGKPVWALINQPSADGTLLRIERANITGGTLTVVGNANATAAVTVRYFIDGR